MSVRLPIFLALVLLACSAAASSGTSEPAAGEPPPVLREFRGVWVATVANIDWPSKPGLPVEQQQAELLAILDRAQELNLNAVVFQVRPACDALYASRLEPWSEFLTGQMGKAPEPFYDPLAFAVEEAHRRGLELHAWFNPYRAHHPAGQSPICSDHISRTHPELVRQYGSYLWLDPGEKGVQDYSIRVITDVVRRYDLDGVHIDDYFYPYKEKDRAGKVLDFPDERSWQAYRAGGGRLSRDDWRRENVDRFIERLYRAIKEEKRWVKFGISPFGIWRPGYPAQIKGFDAYAELYADARKWLANGWLDYFTPQLYWRIEQREQSYPVLLKWWCEQNTKERHLWPGLYTSRVRDASATAWRAEEVVNQVLRTRAQAGAQGNVHFSMKVLMENRDGLADRLRETVYAQPALVPASPWLDDRTPGRPRLRIRRDDEAGGLRLTFRPRGDDRVRLWVVQLREGGEWSTAILPGSQTSYPVEAKGKGGRPDRVAVSAVDRTGNQGPPAIERLRGR
jgi:uncharacterized lipoprotein YddW (UPF0748 family)